ncbi:hypothetical protein DM860_013623 [Cuscuta australis]|uniref:Uncharacterized protein n=1 Tax=Cuscuta australis TaxID=267555 RepID=A0A328EAW3_9ASTE|nr:hypothetical protein DM860_013623 [Cuscuta australis]
MMFVGDSVNRGQFVSMVCLLHRIIPPNAKSIQESGSLTVFTAKEYNATVEFYWAPFLLESNSDDAVVHKIKDRVVRKGSINKHGTFWKGADVIVFDTYLWWMSGNDFKILQSGSFEDKEKDVVMVSTEEAYSMALKTLVRWVNQNMDPNQTRVFFTSMSPSHQKGIEWGGGPRENCYNQTTPIEDPKYWGSECKRNIMRVTGEILGESSVPITFLNITQLSSYRKDAHTSIYKQQWSPLTPEQLADPLSYADCVHWCLPGLPDTWNELLGKKECKKQKANDGVVSFFIHLLHKTSVSPISLGIASHGFVHFLLCPFLVTFIHIVHLFLAASSTKGRVPFAIGRGEEGCDVYTGRWVRDEESRPLYEESDCPYLLPQQTCAAHGRPDKDYLYWKWKPHGCSLPSFNATLMLEALRGKRMMFAGDSLSRGHYSSMLCLLQKTIPHNAKSLEQVGQKTVFTAKEYNATIEFYWMPLLLESNADNPGKHRVDDRIVRVGSIHKHAQHWKGVHILVLHSYLWWFKDEYFKILKGGSFEDEVKDVEEVLSKDAYRMGLQSMLEWVKKNVDLTETRVFFTGMSPTHGRSVEWGGERNGSCYNETSMVHDLNYEGPKSWKKTVRVIDEVLVSESRIITYLNITKLTTYRKDGHTSIYKKQWGPLSQEQLANPVSYADCIHWCLPGVQDTWSELLFTKLFYP